MLAKRAHALTTANFNKLKKYDKHLDVIKDAYFDEIRTPNTFYCTFEEAESCYELVEKCKKVPFKIGDH